MRDEQQRRLIQRIQNGEAAAEGELFQQYKNPILWKICRHIKTDIENIKDLASEVQIAILEGLRQKTFEPEKWPTLEAYIWGVTNNKIRDWFKQEKRTRRLFRDDPPSEDLAAAAKQIV